MFCRQVSGSSVLIFSQLQHSVHQLKYTLLKKKGFLAVKEIKPQEARLCR